MFNKDEFIKDLNGLKQVQKQADELQKIFEWAAEEFTKKYQGAVFKDDKENREYAIYHVQGWNHSFSFDLNGVHSKNKAKIIQKGKYIYLYEFEKMLPTGEFLSDRGETNVVK